MGQKRHDWLICVVAVLFFVVAVAGVLGIRLLITGGDWRCVFSEDPALCATVGEVGR